MVEKKSKREKNKPKTLSQNKTEEVASNETKAGYT